MKNKAYEDIDPNEILSLQEFLTLFSPLPLNMEEKEGLGFYFQMYEKFITSEIKPVDAWITVRNIFAIKNQQIAERMKKTTLHKV